MAWLFPWLLFLHVLGAIVAFGPTFSFSIIGAMGGAEREHANFATRITHALTSKRVLPIGITLPITGLAMIAVVGDQPVRTDALVARAGDRPVRDRLRVRVLRAEQERPSRRRDHVVAAPARRERPAA